MYCGQCGKECQGRWIDEGIGGFEFWGFLGSDSEYSFLSDCCDAEVYSDRELTQPYDPEPEPDIESELMDRIDRADYEMQIIKVLKDG